MMNLDELALKYGSDKSSHWHDYMAEYEKYFAPLRKSASTILELGVGKGTSLRIWEEYFPSANIYGVDISPECKCFEGGRRQVFIGQQEDVAFLSDVCEEIGTPDIIIDDCGHVLNRQVTSLSFLYPKLALGGIYAIEDLSSPALDSLLRIAKELRIPVLGVYRGKLRDESLLILRKSEDSLANKDLQDNYKALRARKVSVKTIKETTTKIDQFMTTGIKKSAKEPFELTQAADVRGWCINPDNIRDIQLNLLDLKKIIDSLNEPISLLDVGCYGGYVYDYLKQKTTYSKHKNSSYTGIDVQEATVKAAAYIHREDANVNFLAGDVFRLSKYFEPRTFDVVCCYRVLIHLPYFEKALSNLIYVADKFVHIVIHIQDKDICRRCEETDLITGKKVIYYHRYISEKTIERALSGLPVSYTIVPAPGNAYASLIIERK